MQMERNNNRTLVSTRSKNVKQEEEHMLIVLHEQVHLASITKEWQWVSDKTHIMNIRQTSKKPQNTDDINRAPRTNTLKIIMNQYMHIAWKQIQSSSHTKTLE